MPFLHKQTRSLAHRIAAYVSPRRCLLAAAILFVLMIAFGSIPGKVQEVTAVVHDKLLHYVAYGVLSGLIYGGLTGRPAMRCIGTLFAVGALGALDEAIQALLPYREASWRDWEVDMMAALTCVVLLPMLHSLYAVLSRSGVPKAQADRPE